MLFIPPAKAVLAAQETCRPTSSHFHFFSTFVSFWVGTLLFPCLGSGVWGLVTKVKT